MNYAQLKTEILEDSHRPDLASKIPEFIRKAEGLIRVSLDAYPLSAVLNDSNRGAPTSARYTLPSGLRRIVQIFAPDGFPLTKVSGTAIDPDSTGTSTRTYADYGTSIVVSGIPGAGSELALEYMGVPAALAADADTNALLNDHESIYKEGALFFLRKRTEDDDQAQRHYDLFMSYITGLNEQYGEKVGGAVTSGGYNFSPESTM